MKVVSFAMSSPKKRKSPAFLTAVFSSVLLTNVHGTHGWDYFVFSLEWPPTYCSSHTCNLPRHMRQQFNIHGLWPTIWPNGSPTNCSRSDFNVKSIEPIYKDLQTQWANLEDFDDPEDFWKHEWNKHGVCSVHSAVISNELDYFNTSLAIKAKVNLLRRLESIGIKPNNKVNLKRDGLLVQLKKLFNVNVLIYCALKHRQPAKLSEIRVCMNPSLDFISCPKSEETEEGEHHSQQQQQQYSVNVCYADEFRVNNNNDVCDTHLPWFNLFPSCPSRQEQKGQQQQPMCTLPMLTSNSPCPEELIFPDFT